MKQLRIKTSHQRMRVYKLALEKLVTKSDETYRHTGLCLLLSEIAFNNDGDNYYEASKLFPEFGEYYNSLISAGGEPVQLEEDYHKSLTEWRIKVMKACIIACEQQIIKSKKSK